MKRRRRHGHAKENPSGTTFLVIGGGLALVGVAAYFIFRKPAATTPAVTGGSTTPQLPAASAAPQLPAGRPFGDPADQNSIAHACNVAWRLNSLGHPVEAKFWADKCAAGGGTVPSSNAQQYT
jgi:hypothetical protein